MSNNIGIGVTIDAVGQISVVLGVDDVTFLLQFAMGFILLLMILVYGSNIVNSIVEEKQNVAKVENSSDRRKISV